MNLDTRLSWLYFKHELDHDRKSGRQNNGHPGINLNFLHMADSVTDFLWTNNPIFVFRILPKQPS